MSERYSDVPEADIIHSYDYQSASYLLLYSVLDVVQPGARVTNPSLEEGMQTVELLPADYSDNIYLAQYDTIGIILHPVEEYPAKEELLATVQLTQPIGEHIYSPDSRYELLTEFRLVRSADKHLVESERLVFDYEIGSLDSLGKISIASPDEIHALCDMISTAEYKPVDI